MRNIKKSVAFTLTEILIVIGIIGIISALAIPNLNKSVSDQEKVTKFKKVYAELSQAHNAALIKYGPVENWFTNDADEYAYSARYFNRITEFLKLQKNCGCTNTLCRGISTNGCMNTLYKSLNKVNSNTDLDSTYYPRAILANGASISYEGKSGTCNLLQGYSSDSAPTCGVIYVDIDGPQNGKQRIGIDLFKLGVTKNGITPAAYYLDSYIESFPDHCLKDGDTCGKWIMDFGNMDYYTHVYIDVYGKEGICNNNESKQLGWPNSTPNAGKTIVQSCR